MFRKLSIIALTAALVAAPLPVLAQSKKDSVVMAMALEPPGLDPTNAIPAGNDHVVLAIGRDYADVAPIDGVIYASGGQRLKVSVSVTPVG